MVDRKRVIKGLECCILRNPDDHARCSQCPYGGNCVNRLKIDALALLKEQETIVRCKDCMYLDSYYVECNKGHNPKPPYDRWFCADGERR